MIQSMTGFGAADRVERGSTYAVELRSVNNRYLKLSIKLPEFLQFLEGDVDRLLRTRLSRGTVHFHLRVTGASESEAPPVNVSMMQRYVDALSSVRSANGVQATIDLAAIATLPGVCDRAPLDEETRARELRTVSELTETAVAELVRMRGREGQALRRDLQGTCDSIRAELDRIRGRAPVVIEEYFERLRARVASLLQAAKLDLDRDALTREVAIYAERCDISEEITRLAAHLEQFEQLCDRGEQVGRTLDFLTQELLREANTIASKSNDAEIARGVVEIKGRIDRLREQVQNVE